LAELVDEEDALPLGFADGLHDVCASGVPPALLHEESIVLREDIGYRDELRNRKPAFLASLLDVAIYVLYHEVLQEANVSVLLVCHPQRYTLSSSLKMIRMTDSVAALEVQSPS
jgi:hypothetical protein